MITLADVDKKITVLQNLLTEKDEISLGMLKNEFRLVKKRAKTHSQCDIAIDMREEFFYPTYWRRVVFVCFLDMCRSNINAFMRTEKQVTQNDRK